MEIYIHTTYLKCFFFQIAYRRPIRIQRNAERLEHLHHIRPNRHHSAKLMRHKAKHYNYKRTKRSLSRQLLQTITERKRRMCAFDRKFLAFYARI